MKNFIKRYKYLIFIIVISLATYFRWLSFSIFANSDYGFQFSYYLREIPSFSIWNSFSFGSVYPLLWRLFEPGSLIFGIFGKIGLDSNVADKFILMWFWIILSGVCSYLLVKKITKSGIGGLIGSFVFSYNTYFLAINTQGHLLLSTASVFAVFFLLFFIKLIEEKKLYLAILTALFLFFTGASDIRILYIVLWVAFFYFIFSIKKPLNYKVFLKETFVSVLPIVFFLLLNVFWIFPALKTGSLAENNYLDRGLFGGSYFDIQKALTLFHPFWTGGEINWFVTQKIPLYFWLIPIFALLGVVLNKRNKDILFFGFIALIGIFLTKEVGGPFGNAYSWLFNGFPGFSAFREASKFYFLTALGYSVLIGSFASWLWINWKEKKWQVYGKYLLVFLISFLFLWNTKSIISGRIDSMFVPRQIPQDYLIFKDFILNQDEFFRTFWTPADSRWGIYTNQKPKVSNVNLINGQWKDYIPALEKDDDKMPINEQIVEIFKVADADRIFDNSSTKYVVVPIENIASDDNFFIYYGEDKNPNIRDWYINELDQIPWLKKIDIGTKELVVYENEDYNPHIYADGLSFQAINPTEYKISIKGLKNTEDLKFLESFHPDWKLYLNRNPNDSWCKEEAKYNVKDDKYYELKQELGTLENNSAKTESHIVKAGESYWSISLDLGIDLEGLLALNNADGTQLPEVGKNILVPIGKSAKEEQDKKIKDLEAEMAELPIQKVTECESNQKFFEGEELSYLTEKPVFDDTHKLVYEYANQWAIDSEYIKKNFDLSYYKVNSDGSIDIELTLYFKSQSYFYLGLMASGATLFGCVTYLIIIIATNNKKRRKKFIVKK